MPGKDREPAQATAKPLKAFQSPLLTHQIESAMRQTASIQTMEFLWHCSVDINNRTINKNRGDMPYSTLPRMELIPVYAWPVPVIKAKNASFSVSNSNLAGASLGPTGVSVTQRAMLSHETRTLLEKWYGHEGLLILESLTTNTDEGKLEARALYSAIMESGRTLDDGSDGVIGADLVIQDLPEFFDKEAPVLLQLALEKGSVKVKDSSFWPGFPQGSYKLEETALRKGLRLIADLKRNTDATIDYVLNDETGVLKITRGQIQQAHAGIKDSKSRTDRRDEFFITQFPDFSLDTAVERAARGTSKVVESIERSSSAQADVQTETLTTMREMLAELLDQRKKSDALEAQLRKLAEKPAA